MKTIGMHAQWELSGLGSILSPIPLHIHNTQYLEKVITKKEEE
jgi:hypothetical protein